MTIGKGYGSAIVFGATGFVGSYLIRALLKEDWQVWAVTRGPKHFIIPVSGQGLHWVTWNEIGNLFEADEQNNYKDIFVFHLAANLSVSESLDAPENFIRQNVGLTIKVVDFLRSLHFKPCVIYLSSDRVYGHASGLLSEEIRPNPIDPYGLSKYFGEEILRIMSLLYSLKVIIVRASNLYGPFQRPEQFIPSLFHRFWKGNKLISVGNLAVKRDYLFIDDLVHGLILLTSYSSNESFDVFHFANIVHHLEEVTSIFKLIAKNEYGREIGFSVDQNLMRSPKNELGDFVMTTEKALRELNWKPIISLHEGIETIFNQEVKLYA